MFGESARVDAVAPIFGRKFGGSGRSTVRVYEFHYGFVCDFVYAWFSLHYQDCHG